MLTGLVIGLAVGALMNRHTRWRLAGANWRADRLRKQCDEWAAMVAEHCDSIGRRVGGRS